MNSKKIQQETPQGGSTKFPIEGTEFSQDHPFFRFQLQSLKQYRVKSYCNYDPSDVNSGDYSVFQLEIVDPEIQKFHQGRYVLEVWTRGGERIYQKVLKEECQRWKLFNNVLVFKTHSEAAQVYVAWLNERKMASIRHPFDDHQEVDMIYFEGHLVIASKNQFKCLAYSPLEINTTVQAYQENGEAIAPIVDKDTSTQASKDLIVGLVPHPHKQELMFVCQNEKKEVEFNRLVVQVNEQNKRVISLQKLVIDEKTQKKSKLSKAQKGLVAQENLVLKMIVVHKQDDIYLVLLKQNQILEVYKNFSIPHYAEQVPKLVSIYNWFGDKLILAFDDANLLLAQIDKLEKVKERLPLNHVDYHHQLTYPPATSTLGDTHKNVYFFSDMVIVNQSYFLLRENIVLIYDQVQKEFIQIFISKVRIVGLYKLKLSTEDDQQYKQVQYKVVAVHKNGTLSVFTPRNQVLQNNWQKQDVQTTAMLQQKDVVVGAFQNQNSLSNLYINTLTVGGDQKIYQVMFNSSIIEMNFKLAKTDICFSVNYTTRNREILGVLEQKYLTIYKNEKGNATRQFQVNLLGNEIREQLISNNAIYFFHRDYLLILCNNFVHRISTRSNTIDTLSLGVNIQSQLGSCFLDTQYFYFISKNDDKYQVNVLGLDMVDQAFQESLKDGNNAINLGKKKQEKQVLIPFSSWEFPISVRKLDYDEFNMSFAYLLTNLEVQVSPILHRNTLAFQGMAERSFYIAFKQHGEKFYALDRSSHMSCWDVKNGQFLGSYKTDIDYSDYDVDRAVYDKDWYPFTLISKRVPKNQEEENLLNEQFDYLNYKVIQIDERGYINERLSFVHPYKVQNDQHLYLNLSLNRMIEVLINKQKRNAQPAYNLYELEVGADRWTFVETLDDSLQWHQKSLFPYNFDVETLQELDSVALPEDSLYKSIGGGRVKVLNLKDGIEMIINQGEIESYFALMYQFQTTQDSFYDKRSGQQFIQDITERLQNYYENIRRRVFLDGKWSIETSSLDVSARSFKNKYIIEQSFTYIDYRFLQTQVVNNQKRNLLQVLKSMSEDQVKRMVNNVFPEYKETLLHHIADNIHGSECVDYLTELAKKGQFVIPFLFDKQGNTPLDIVVENKDHKQTNSLVKMLSKTPMDHHSRLIAHQLPKLIEMNIQALEKYFDRRKYKTGFCRDITLGRIRIRDDQEYKSLPSTLVNNNEQQLREELFHQAYREQTVSLEILDIPLNQERPLDHQSTQHEKHASKNQFEVQLIYALSNSQNTSIFQQKSIRSFIDFLWPKTKQQIIYNLLIPYLAFILYYMLYLVVKKKLNLVEMYDDTFFTYTSGLFDIVLFVLATLLFIGCLYFFSQDIQQLQNVTHNGIIMWTYANILPLFLIILLMAAEELFKIQYQTEEIVFSLSAFFVWVRVIHLLKCFSETAFLIRMASQILYKMRFLIIFILIATIAFGYTYYFLQSDANFSPSAGLRVIFMVLIGNFEGLTFDSFALNILLLLVICFAYFFVFTLLISLAVFAYTQDCDTNSNQAYQEKASMIALYSHLLKDKAVRDPKKEYLLIATVTETKSNSQSSGSQGLFSSNSGSDESKQSQTKYLKSIDRKYGLLTSKFEKQFKELSERLDLIQDIQKKEQQQRQKLKI